jgi:hypothetical protein
MYFCFAIARKMHRIDHEMQSDLHSSANPSSDKTTARVLNIARSGQCSGREMPGSRKDEIKL